MKKIHVISIKISINCQSSKDLVCTKAVYQCISREIIYFLNNIRTVLKRLPMMKKYQRQSFQTTDRAYHRILLFPVILTMDKTLYYM
jgi:hypothetical protein